jgi:hypothetical protein
LRTSELSRLVDRLEHGTLNRSDFELLKAGSAAIISGPTRHSCTAGSAGWGQVAPLAWRFAKPSLIS